jgi:hypothetical protein
MISFGRLSADGEWAALLASGYSLARAAIPVMIIAGFLYGLGLLCSMHLEAWGRRELVNFTFRKTQTEVDNMIKFKLQPGVFMDNFLGFVLYAEKISPDRSRFENMMLAPGPKMPTSHSYTMLAPVGRIVGSVEEGELKLAMDYGMSWNTSADGEKTSVLKFRRAEIDLLRIFRHVHLTDSLLNLGIHHGLSLLGFSLSIHLAGFHVGNGFVQFATVLLLLSAALGHAVLDVGHGLIDGILCHLLGNLANGRATKHLSPGLMQIDINVPGNLGQGQLVRGQCSKVERNPARP